MRESIIEVLKTLGEAIVLVILVMFLFLQNWRSTLIPAITIPVSLIGTFAFVKLLRLLDQHADALRHRARHRHRRRRRDRRDREHRAAHARVREERARRRRVDAMREVFCAVVVIGIVLVAVFVPVAFFPGTTGRLYQQFSLTIAFAVVLSVFNAVTFTPALSALLLDKETPRARPVLHGREPRHRRRHERLRARACAARCGCELVDARCCSSLALGATWLDLSARCPSSFVPDEDEGYFITIVQAPAGASLEYTTNIAKQAEQIILQAAGHRRRCSRCGLQLQRRGAEQRPDVRAAEGLRGARGRRALARRGARIACAGQLFGIPGALVIPFAPPAIQGLSAFGGFQFEVLDQIGRRHHRAWRTSRSRWRAQATSRGRVAGLFSQLHAPTIRSSSSTIDRDRARSLGLPMREVTDALQVLLGSQYVNDFDFNNRAYRVYVQARPAVPRAAGRPAAALRARAERRTWCRSTAVVRAERDDGAAGHQPLQPVPLGGDHRRRRAGRELGPGARRTMEQIARETLPPGFDFAWAGQSLEEIKAGSQAVYLFALSDPARLPGAGGAVRELGAAVHHPARRAARGVRRARARSCCAGSPTTCSARSGWSC